MKIHRTLKTSELSLEDDMISSMPDNVIVNILHCLPIQDAVRTGILCRDWRFKWTMMTQLNFDDYFYIYLQNKGRNQNFGRIINRLLLHLRGDITKFVLYIENYDDNYDDLELDAEFVEDFDNWVMFLSRKGIKEFTLINFGTFINDTPLKLPSHLFSCRELNYLRLTDCSVCPMPSFCGFPNLLSLCLVRVTFKSYTCGELLTRCPLLESLIIEHTTPDTTYNIKRTQIAKLENLKVLSLPFCIIENRTMITPTSIFQLLAFFTKLQEVALDIRTCKFLADTMQIDPIVLPCLKTLNLYQVDFGNGIMVSCVVELICSSPNLKTLNIRAKYFNQDPPSLATYSSKVECGRISQLKLQTVRLDSIRGSENEACFMKFLLASSPLLKKMIVFTVSSEAFGGDGAAVVFTTKLLKFHRASPVAEIDFLW